VRHTQSKFPSGPAAAGAGGAARLRRQPQRLVHAAGRPGRRAGLQRTQQPPLHPPGVRRSIVMTLTLNPKLTLDPIAGPSIGPAFTPTSQPVPQAQPMANRFAQPKLTLTRIRTLEQRLARDLAFGSGQRRGHIEAAAASWATSAQCDGRSQRWLPRCKPSWEAELH